MGFLKRMRDDKCLDRIFGKVEQAEEQMALKEAFGR